MRRLVVGDIHGAHKALLQTLERSAFDPKQDQLICLGDIVDGYPQVAECIETLMTIPNLILVMGNHDLWFVEWMRSARAPEIWTSQGGRATLKSITGKDVRPYQRFFERWVKAYVTEDKKVFVHGGLDVTRPIEEQYDHDLMWDRDLAQYVIYGVYSKLSQIQEQSLYSEIYIGHTTTERKSLTPMNWGNVFCLDQGAGWGGRLTIMDVDTKEFWQSDCVLDLYPEGNRRGR